MRILVSLSSDKELIVKGSRIAVRHSKDYWLATVTRRKSDGTVSVTYDEGTKDPGLSLRSGVTHLPDNTRMTKKPLTKEQVQAIVEKGKAAAAKEKAKVKPTVKPPVTVKPKIVAPVKVVRPSTPKVVTPKTPAQPPLNQPKIETLSELRDYLRQLEWEERADNKRGHIPEERKKWFLEQAHITREKIKKLSPEPEKDANELVYRHQEFDTTPNKQAAIKNKSSLDAMEKFHKVDLGDLFKTDHRQIQTLFLDEMSKAGFKKMQTLVSPKTRVNSTSLAVPIDFGVGKGALDSIVDRMIQIIADVGKRSGLTPKISKGHVLLVAAMGDAQFYVHINPFADLKHGLLSIELF